MKWKIAYGAFSALILAAVIAALHEYRDCWARGGVLVKGMMAYECIAAAPVKP